MTSHELHTALGYLTDAANRLGDVLAKDPAQDDAYLDASIQRFEFTFELAWKCLKRFLEREGTQVQSPREALVQAFLLGWLPDGDAFWVQMLQDRNRTSHTYHLNTALDIYSRLPAYLTAVRGLAELLRHRLDGDGAGS